MTLRQKFRTWYRQRRYALQLWLFPRLREYENLSDRLNSAQTTVRRLEVELAISRDQTKAARDEAQTSAISARAALDRAAQLAFANEQLQAQLTTTMADAMNRIERAYGATANHMAMGGAATRRPLYPWIPSAAMPDLPKPDLTVPIDKQSGRGVIRKNITQFLKDHAARVPREAQSAMDEIQRKIDSGEWIINALGQPVPASEGIGTAS